jgi:hypothetical protein
MYNPISPLKSSQPLNENVVGMFCYPKPFAPGGTIAVDSSDPRPLIIGTDVVIVEDGGLFKLAISLDISLWGVNIGDYVGFSTPELSGSYIITDMPDLATIYVAGPGAAIASGNIWFIKAKQKVTGTGTKFTRNVTAGRWIVVMDSTLTPTVQACKVAKIVSDTELLVEKGFITAISAQPFMVPSGKVRGVSIQCGGAGFINGTAVVEGDTPTFYQDSGLDPVYGDSGANTFNILIQK